MKDVMVSVIIPVYNTMVKLFQRCIKSIEEQPYKLVEVLVIDDGSQEDISECYFQICQYYNNIKYIRQRNLGVSSARNRGIRESLGKYIVFVDADDVIASSFITNGIKLIKRYNEPDIILGEIKYVNYILDTDVFYTYKKVSKHKELNIKKENIDKLKLLMLGIYQKNIDFEVTGSPCGRLYKRDIAMQIKFPEKITHWEDQIYNRLFLNLAESAVLTDEVWYFYYQNEFSAMHNMFNEKFIERSRPFWNIWKQLNSLEKGTTQIEYKKKSVDYFYAAIHINILHLDCKWKEKREMMEELIREPIFHDVIHTLAISDFGTFKEKMKFRLMKEKRYRMMYCLVKIKDMFKERKNETKRGIH